MEIKTIKRAAWLLFLGACLFSIAIWNQGTQRATKPNQTSMSVLAEGVTPDATPAQKSKEEQLELIGSTPQRRLAASKRLGIAEGGWVVLLASPTCNSCDRVAADLKSLSLAGLPGFRVVALLEAPPSVVENWRERLGIRYQTKAISSKDFEDFAGSVIIYPTVVVINNGVAMWAGETAPKVKR